MADLQIVEHIVREDPKVIEQCGIIGIPKEDMYKVYCDRGSPSAYLELLLTGPKLGLSDTTKDSATKSACSKL